MAFIGFIESVFEKRVPQYSFWNVMWFCRACSGFSFHLAVTNHTERDTHTHERKTARKWNHFYLKKSRCQLKFIYLLVANCSVFVTWAIFIALSIFLHIFFALSFTKKRRLFNVFGFSAPFEHFFSLWMEFGNTFSHGYHFKRNFIFESLQREYVADREFSSIHNSSAFHLYNICICIVSACNKMRKEIAAAFALCKEFSSLTLFIFCDIRHR